MSLKAILYIVWYIRIVMQKIIIATDSFKDGLDATAVCHALKRGLLRADSELEVATLPLGDGGEGTAALLTNLKKATWKTVEVQNPLGSLTTAGYGWNDLYQTAYLDMAEASGLQLLNNEERDPFQTSTFGFGQLLVQVLQEQPQEIIIGIGGSATSEGGIGMASALGFQFLDNKHHPLSPIGAHLNTIQKIIPPSKLPIPDHCRIKVLCDVNNPLYGPNGAAAVFSPQKGASAAQVEELDKGLQHLAHLIERDLGIDIHQLRGGGAAGGLGAGLVAFAKAELCPGIDTILEMVNFQDIIQGADFIITGEGKIDGQTGGGKLIQGICQMAASQNIPVVALCGTLQASPQEIQKIGLRAAFSILDSPMLLAEALQKTEALLETSAEHLVNTIYLTKA
jgi:glycerate kinase